ncbi:triose-phosphate isomerase [candidate division WOR-3 bacterium]|nr:triose-phosphate isomerase [candidate division WOR-3 bacterium]
MAKFSVKDLAINGKKVFVRVDFNVPFDEDMKITDDTRIRSSLPTIKYILEQGGIPVIASHLGRPKGKVNPKMSLAPVARRLTELLHRKVIFAPDCIGDEVKKLAEGLKQGDILLLENTRFHPEEKRNDPDFAKELASFADLYVNDAFGTAHRAHASVAGVAVYFDKPACGFLMAKEIELLEAVLKKPKRPLLAIMGGAKVSTKIGGIRNLLKIVDHLIIGGGMCFTFFKARGYEIGKSLCEDAFLEEATVLLNNQKIYLPVDVLVAKEIRKGSPTECVEACNMPADYYGVDIGEKTRKDIAQMVSSVKTIVWNGPMGIFEIDEFTKGTAHVARSVADATTKGVVSIVGGGDTIAALSKYGLPDEVTHVSTGGGATLQFLEGKKLPGIEALKDKIILKSIIAGNWKMNKDPAESRSLVRNLLELISDVKNREVILIPPFTSLPIVAEVIRNSNVKLGAQNMYWERSGAYTGEISGLFLKSIGCEYVVIGHSERRHIMGETDEMLNKKLKTALEIGLIAIFCVGETEKEKEEGMTEQVISRQLKQGLKDIENEAHKIIFAYEPVWAIGTGKTATPQQVVDVHKFIRAQLKKKSTILYGGSVKPENIDTLMHEQEIEGVLVGGASLKPESFARIIKFSIT